MRTTTIVSDSESEGEDGDLYNGGTGLAVDTEMGVPQPNNNAVVTPKERQRLAKERKGNQGGNNQR